MAESMQVKIYGLIDPVTKMCRYVGKTKGSLRARFKAHLSDAKRNTYVPRFRWILKLEKIGLMPEAIELESVDQDEWQDAEQFWIAYMRFLGSPLLNATQGGDGLHGHKHSDETKARMSASAKRAMQENPDLNRIRGEAVRAAFAKPGAREALSERLRISHARPEVKLKLCACAKAKASTPEFKARMAAACAARVFSPETRKKISDSRKGKKLSQEVIDRMAAGHRGLKHSEDTKAKMRATWARKKLERQAA